MTREPKTLHARTMPFSMKTHDGDYMEQSQQMLSELHLISQNQHLKKEESSQFLVRHKAGGAYF